MVHLATAADEAYAAGLLVSVASSLHSLEDTQDVTFHILDGGLTRATHQKLTSLCETLHRHCTLVFHQIKQQQFQQWRPGPQGSMMTYARLLLGSLVQASRVIYLDTDMLVLGDLNEVWNTSMNGMIGLGCHDGRIPKLDDDCPWQLMPDEKELCYVNAGFLLLDLDQWRTQKVEEQALQLIAESSVVYRWWDQTILNYLLRNRLGILPISWNWQDRKVSIADASIINLIHFKSKKPWFWWSGDLRFRLWRSFYQAFIGSPLKLFLQNGSWGGLLYGFFEIQIRRYPWFRAIYVRFLIVLSAWKKNSSSLQITKDYYTDGLGSKKGDGEFKKNQPALKILEHRLNIR